MQSQINNNISNIQLSDIGEFLDNLPKVSDASKAAMETDLTLEELQDTMKSKGMKDTAPGPDGIPYSVYGKFWTMSNKTVSAQDLNMSNKTVSAQDLNMSNKIVTSQDLNMSNGETGRGTCNLFLFL